MKIKSVVVDKLPDSCSSCRLKQWRMDKKQMNYFCYPLDENIDLIKYLTTRQSSCPLRLERKNDDHENI